MEERRGAFKILTGRTTGKRPLGRPRRRWEDTIRVDLKEIGIKLRNWDSQDMLDSTNSDPDFMNTIFTGDEPWMLK